MSDPAPTAPLIQQGLFHHRQGDLKLAMDRYTDVLRTDPDNADALYYSPWSPARRTNSSRAWSLPAARSPGPASARAHNLLGSALEALGEPWRRSRPSIRPSSSTPISPRRTATAPTSW